MAEIVPDVKLSNLLVSNISLQPAPVVLSNASNVSLTSTDHASRLLVVPDHTSNSIAYILPDPERAGERYQFIYSGVPKMQTDAIIRTNPTTNDVFFRGAVTLLETRTASNSVVFANSTNHSNLQVIQPEALDLEFVSANTTCYIVSGTVTSTASAVSFNTQTTGSY